MRPKGYADWLVHEEAHLVTTNSLQTILERVDVTAANILCQFVPTQYAVKRNIVLDPGDSDASLSWQNGLLY